MFDRFTKGKDTTFFGFAKNYLFKIVIQHSIQAKATV